MKVDINCDVGEGIQNEHVIMPYISSCNIACGGHFGDANSIDKTLAIAIKNKVKIGAHPSYPDVKNFGRIQLEISDENLKMHLENQMDLFLERLSYFDEKLHHIKPHGALYNALAVDEKLAWLFVEILRKYLKNVFLYVPYNSVIEKVALKNNINIKQEAFADRNYNFDGTLVARSHQNALITSKEKVFEHLYQMIKHKKVITISGDLISMNASTFCFHSDTENALEMIQFVTEKLKNKGVLIG